MSEKNYFEDLGIDSTATLTEVRRAFRRLALRYHPDRNPGDQSAVEMYLKITEAYQNLNSENALHEMRRIFEASATDYIPPQVKTAHQNRPLNPEDRRISVRRESAKGRCTKCGGKREIKIKRGAFVRTQVCPQCAQSSLPVK